MAQAGMIALAEAQRRLLALASPLAAETVSIAQCAGRFLAGDVLARRSQPAANLSAMDGYAIRHCDLSGKITVIGESAAGKPYEGAVAAGQAVRIFTGAHVPVGADTIVMQENVVRNYDALKITEWQSLQIGAHIRPVGSDFSVGATLLTHGTMLNAGSIAAAVMGGFGALSTGNIPRVAIIGSGDELVPPGLPTSPAQIPSSNNNMLLAMLGSVPCDAADMGNAADSIEALKSRFSECDAFDVIVSSGGASVGDHDLVQASLTAMGADIDFWQVAVKPGKPIMAGRLGKSVVIGLPGNPGSAFVTGVLFLLPLVRHLAGSSAPLPSVYVAKLNAQLPESGVREEYLRAVVNTDGITALTRQDSGMTTMLAAANALLIRPPHSAPARAGSTVPYILL